MHLAPELRRLRALPAWFTLMAYGRSGYQTIVERNARRRGAGAMIESGGGICAAGAVRLNVVCFTLAGAADAADGGAFLARP